MEFVEEAREGYAVGASAVLLGCPTSGLRSNKKCNPDPCRKYKFMFHLFTFVYRQPCLRERQEV